MRSSGEPFCRCIALGLAFGFGISASCAGLEGSWEGFVSVTPAKVRRILAFFEPSEAGWKGTIDVPGMNDVPIEKITLDQQHLSLVLDLEGQRITFDGNLVGDELSGNMRLDGSDFTFELYHLPELEQPSNRVEAWNQDLDQVVNRFLRYDRSFSAAARKGFLDDIVRLRESLKTKSDPEIIVALSRAIASSGNAHTRLYLLRNRTALRRLPIRTYWFNDGLFVVDAADAYRPLVGCKVTSIAHVDPRKLKRWVGRLFAGNQGWVDYKSPFFMTSPEILAGIGVIDDMDSIPLRFVCGDGETSLRSLQPLPLERRSEPTEPWWDLATFHSEKHAVPLYLKTPQEYYRFDHLRPQETVYFRYNRSKNMAQGESFDEFASRLTQFIREHELKRFVVDLRFNTGGDNGIAADFMEQLAQLEQDGALGRLFVLIGRSTFSAGISHAAALKQFTGAVFIGEPVGDVLDTWSEGGNIALPNSGLTVHFTNGFHSLSRVRRPELERYYWTDLEIENLDPDLLVPLSSVDFFAGRDPILEAVFDYAE